MTHLMLPKSMLSVGHLVMTEGIFAPIFGIVTQIHDHGDGPKTYAVVNPYTLKHYPECHIAESFTFASHAELSKLWTSFREDAKKVFENLDWRALRSRVSSVSDERQRIAWSLMRDHAVLNLAYSFFDLATIGRSAMLPARPIQALPALVEFQEIYRRMALSHSTEDGLWRIFFWLLFGK